MKFNIMYKTISKRGLTSAQVRKVLSEAGVSNKDGKKAISLGIDHHRNDLRVSADILTTPVVTVVKNSIPKEVRLKYAKALEAMKEHQAEQKETLKHNIEAKYAKGA